MPIEEHSGNVIRMEAVKREPIHLDEAAKAAQALADAAREVAVVLRMGGGDPASEYLEQELMPRLDATIKHMRRVIG